MPHIQDSLRKFLATPRFSFAKGDVKSLALNLGPTNSDATTTATPMKTSLENISSRNLYPLRDYSNSFNLFNVAELFSNRTGGNGLLVSTENEKFTVMHSQVLHKTLNLVISSFIFFFIFVVVLPRTAKKCIKICPARAKPSFCSLSLLFTDVLNSLASELCLCKREFKKLPLTTTATRTSQSKYDFNEKTKALYVRFKVRYISSRTRSNSNVNYNQKFKVL